MARYIDAKKQFERYKKKLYFYIEEEGEDTFSAKCEEIRAAMEALKNAPTADVVEVVRCKDCIHFTGEWYGMCKKDKERPFIPVTCNHYCSYGKKVE